MERHAGLPQGLKESILGPQGTVDLGLRQAIEARAEELAGGAPAETAAIPENLREYVDTVALHAYRITDEDIQTLLRSGYSEDAVFEISTAAAVGAGMARLERGLAALKGSPR